MNGKVIKKQKVRKGSGFLDDAIQGVVNLGYDFADYISDGNPNDPSYLLKPATYLRGLTAGTAIAGKAGKVYDYGKTVYGKVIRAVPDVIGKYPGSYLDEYYGDGLHSPGKKTGRGSGTSLSEVPAYNDAREYTDDLKSVGLDPDQPNDPTTVHEVIALAGLTPNEKMREIRARKEQLEKLQSAPHEDPGSFEDYKKSHPEEKNLQALNNGYNMKVDNKRIYDQNIHSNSYTLNYLLKDFKHNEEQALKEQADAKRDKMITHQLLHPPDD